MILNVSQNILKNCILIVKSFNQTETDLQMLLPFNLTFF